MSQQAAWIVLGIIFSGLTIVLSIRLFLHHNKEISFNLIDVAMVIVLTMIAVISWFNVFGLFD